MAFVQTLRQRQGGFGRKAKAAIGLALQRGQVKQQRAGLGGRLAFFGDAGGLATHRVGDCQGFGLRPDAIGFLLSVVGVLLPLRIKPLGRVLTSLGEKAGVNFPVITADKFANLLLAYHHHRQRRRLHAAYGGEKEAAVARVECGHRPCAVDAHQPVGF